MSLISQSESVSLGFWGTYGLSLLHGIYSGVLVLLRLVDVL